MLQEKLMLAGRALKWLPRVLASGPKFKRTVADLIEECAASRSQHRFVVFEGRELSYAEFNAAANRVAHWALAGGIGRGDVVALLMQNRLEFLVIWAGLAKAGVTIALLNTNQSGDALAHSLKTVSARRLIVGSECLPQLESLVSSVRQGLELFVSADLAQEHVSLPHDGEDFDQAVGSFSTENPPRRVRDDLHGEDILFLIYTSGTTGLPKAARFSHSRFLAAGVHSLLSGFGPEDTMYCALPLYHTVGGVMAVNAVLTSGGTLALSRKFSAGRFWDEIVECDATAFQYIGEFCRYLINQPYRPAERAHRIKFCVGNGLRPDIWQEFKERFHIPKIVEFYGATEANVAMINFDNKVGSVGKLPPGLKARLICYDIESGQHLRDKDGFCIPCADGKVGELIGRISHGASAAGRFEGYTSEAANESKILCDVFTPGDMWFRSGDLLRRDRDGYYYFVDRIGDTFRWKGENVSTQEVAEVVSTYPKVAMCAVYGVDVPGSDGRAGMAALQLRGDQGFSGRDLYAHLCQLLPLYAAPAFLRIQDHPEMTATFKLRKIELQKEGFDPSSISDPLYYRHDGESAYLPLNAEVHAKIQNHSLRL